MTIGNRYFCFIYSIPQPICIFIVLLQCRQIFRTNEKAVFKNKLLGLPPENVYINGNYFIIKIAVTAIYALFFISYHNKLQNLTAH